MSPRASALAAAVAAAVALALPGSAAAASCAGQDALPGTPEFEAGAEAATLCLLNQERAAHGLGTLRTGPSELRDPAVSYARDMVARKFFAHESPDGVTLLERLDAYTVGAWWTVGENLAWGEASRGTPAEIMQAWMNSPGHRANILNGRFEEVGIGVVPGAPQDVSRAAATYVTEFGARTAGSSDAVVVPESPATTPRRPSTARAKTTSKRSSTKRRARCKRVSKRVRRDGRTVRVKRFVCPKRTTSRAAKRARATRRSAR